MNVHTVRVSYTREKQPRDYEKAIPFVEFSAEVEDGEDYKGKARELMVEACSTVYAAIGSDIPNKVAEKLCGTVKAENKNVDKAVEEATETAKNARKAAATKLKPKATTKAKPAAKPKPKPKPTDNEIPSDDEVPTEDNAEDNAEDDGDNNEVTKSDVSKAVGQYIQKGKLKLPILQEILMNFDGRKHLSDLDTPEMRAEFMTMLEEKMSEK